MLLKFFPGRKGCGRLDCSADLSIPGVIEHWRPGFVFANPERQAGLLETLGLAKLQLGDRQLFRIAVLKMGHITVEVFRILYNEGRRSFKVQRGHSVRDFAAGGENPSGSQIAAGDVHMNLGSGDPCRNELHKSRDDHGRDDH